MVDMAGVTKIYGEGEQKVTALNNLSLSIREGERVAIIGKSGAGKSTLLHLLAAVNEPTSGSIRVGDVEVSSLKKKEKVLYRRRNVGIVFQFFHLIPVLTVRENIMLPIEVDAGKVNVEEVEELAEKLGVKDKLSKPFVRGTTATGGDRTSLNTQTKPVVGRRTNGESGFQVGGGSVGRTGFMLYTV